MADATPSNQELADAARAQKTNEVLGIAEPQEIEKRRYSEEEHMLGLVALARNYGSPAKAQHWLIEQRDFEVPAGTLRDWRNSADYERVARQYGTELEGVLIREARENAHAAAAVERKAIEMAENMLDTQAHRLRLSDVHQAARSMTEIKSKNLDKVLVMTGRPKDVIEKRDFDSVIQTLMTKGLLQAAKESEPHIDIEAEEILGVDG